MAASNRLQVSMVSGDGGEGRRPRVATNFFAIQHSNQCAAAEAAKQAARDAARQKKPRTDEPAGNGKGVDTDPDCTGTRRPKQPRTEPAGKGNEVDTEPAGKGKEVDIEHDYTDTRRTQEMLHKTETRFEATHVMYDYALHLLEGLQNGPKGPLSDKVVDVASLLVKGIDAQLCAHEDEIKRLKGTDYGGFVVDDEQCEMRRLQSELDQKEKQHTLAWEWYLKIDDERSSLLLRIEELEELKKEKCTAGTSGSQANGSASGGRAAGGSA